MEEIRQIEKTEIVETESVAECASVRLQLASERLSDVSLVGCDRYQARLLKLTPFELATRRTIGQVLDFLIAYCVPFLYFYQSGAIFHNSSEELIHPFFVNIALSGNWDSIWPFALLPVPYLYLCWYFRDFLHCFTPGEMIVGIGRLRAASDSARWSFLYPFRQFCQVVFALAWGIIVMTPLCSLVGLILLNFGFLFGVRRGELVDKATYMLVSGLPWILVLSDKAPDQLRIFLCIFLCIISPVAFALSVLFQVNLPADGEPIQSPCDLRYGIQSRAIRKIRKNF